MKKIEDAFQLLFSLVLFILLIFGLYKAIENKDFGLSLGLLSVLFIFSFLMIEVGKIKRFKIGGDKVSVSVNEGSDEPKV